jgi:uncharacterized protein (DUF2267 family)
MDHDEIVNDVRSRTGLDTPEALRLIRATLRTLGDRLSVGQAADIGAALPPALRTYVTTESNAEGFDLEEFARRVAERAGVDRDDALILAGAVFATLGEAVGPKEVADMAAEFPIEYTPLITQARSIYLDVLPAADFLRRVGDRAAVDGVRARRATEATLETLAEMLEPGDRAELQARLPDELHEPLRRVDDQDGRPPGVQLSRETFVRRVADREGTDVLTAAQHAQAVFETLREAVGDEFLDVRAHLPAEYADLLAHS